MPSLVFVEMLLLDLRHWWVWHDD